MGFLKNVMFKLLDSVLNTGSFTGKFLVTSM